MSLIPFSKSLAIKLWLNGQETFNEKTEPAITRFPWLQKWNLTDNIRYQFIDTEYKSYRFAVIDYEGETDPASPQFVQIGTKAFSVSATTGGYRYDITFTMSELGVTDGQQVKVLLISEAIAAPIPGSITGDFDITGLLGTFAGIATAGPDVAILSFDEYYGGTFRFELNRSVDNNIVVSAANVTGSIIPGCVLADETDTLSGPLTITAGSIIGIKAGVTPLGLTITTYKKINSIVVNGLTKTNGDTFTSGTTLITVSIGGCTTYPH
jgi:hypothetical protein